MRQKQNRSAWMCLWLYSSFLPAWAAFTLVAVGLCSCVCAKITFRFLSCFCPCRVKKSFACKCKSACLLFISLIEFLKRHFVLLDCCQHQQHLWKLLVRSPSPLVQSHECWRTCSFTSLRVSCRPAAGSRAGEDPSGEEQGAGAGAQADVLQQPGTTAGDRGKYLPSLTKYSPKQSSH